MFLTGSIFPPWFHNEYYIASKNVIIENHGTVVLFAPESDYEHKWLLLNTDSEPWQWQGRALVVDHRPAADLIEVLEHEGFIIERQ